MPHNSANSQTNMMHTGERWTQGAFNPTGQVIAVKSIKLAEDETFDDLVIEIEVLSRCHHPNIVGYFGCWRKKDELFIAMEYCDGGSTADIYETLDSGLAEEEIKVICRESLKGLAYMHSLGFLHRDIKGANILVKRDGSVKLIDFGVSGKVSAASPTRRTFIGTPYWMAMAAAARHAGRCDCSVCRKYGSSSRLSRPGSRS